MNHIRRSLAIVALLAVLVVSVWLTSATAHADDGSDLLDGSTNALIVGPTGFPDVSRFPGYIPTVDTLYLDPLGYGGTGAAFRPAAGGARHLSLRPAASPREKRTS